jgi:hypothetical protein
VVSVLIPLCFSGFRDQTHKCRMHLQLTTWYQSDTWRVLVSELRVLNLRGVAFDLRVLNLRSIASRSSLRTLSESCLAWILP